MENQTKGQSLLVLLLLVPAPTLGSLAAMWFEPTRGTSVGQGLYMFCKLWLLALPLVWWKLVEKQPLSYSPMKQGGLWVGAGLGLLMGLVIYAAGALLGPSLVDVAHLREQVSANGLDTPLKYLGLCAYLALVNSLLEEYVWRWFVFRHCERLSNTTLATIASALFFTLHHIVALKAQMGWGVTLLGSLGVFSGGLIWSWCYARYRSVWPGYVSHIIADVAIFILGWQWLFAN